MLLFEVADRNITVKFLALLIRMWKVQGSNVATEIAQPDNELVVFEIYCDALFQVIKHFSTPQGLIP